MIPRINELKHLLLLMFKMFYINEMTLKEIADMLGIPIGTVKNRIFRAKEKLKELLLKDFSYEELKQYA